MTIKELDARIRKAVEADFQQWLTDSLTPDRGYQTPIDNVRALVMKTKVETLREAAAVSRKTFSDPSWHGFHRAAAEIIATKLDTEAELITGPKDSK